MITIRHLVLAVLVTACLMLSLFQMLPASSQVGEYDPWIDTNDDGIIDIFDIAKLALAFGAEGEPISKTAMLLELEARIDSLNATVMALGEPKHYAGIEQKVTNPLGEIAITFPVGMFTKPPKLSAAVLVLSGPDAGKVCYIYTMSIGTASATLTLQTWDGSTWFSISAGTPVQVSYTAVQN